MDRVAASTTTHFRHLSGSIALRRDRYVHEVVVASFDGIGISHEIEQSQWWSSNDRIIYAWQKLAGRYDEKTIIAHLVAIRFCEDIASGKSFKDFNQDDVTKVRDELKLALARQDGTGKSKSSVTHAVSHLTAFFDWLLKHEGYRRLPRDLPEYFMLPRSAYSKALPQQLKPYANIDEAKQLLLNMPSRTVIEKRARAIFALGYLGALRADTLVSLRVCHFITNAKLIVQDAFVVRTKNGKSLKIHWFPILKCFSDEVISWVSKLEALGISGQDALFPSKVYLEIRLLPDPKAIEPMSAKHAVGEAFAIACRDQEISYTPHSAKHTMRR